MRTPGEIIPGVTPTGEIPEYVPPHLRGKVWDFQNEPGGNVSFTHPEASMGLAPDQSRVSLTPEKYRQTFDQPSRFADFTRAMNEQYAPMDRAQKTLPRQMNEGIANALRKAFNWGTSSQGKSVGTVGLLSALGGGLGSYLWDRNKGDDGSSGKALLMALLAGGAGAAATAYGQNRHNSRENFLAKTASMEVATALVRLLDGDPTLNRYDRAKILNALSQAPNADRDQLYRLMRTSMGAGAGMLAMRFLGAKGLLPMLAGGIIGGMLGGNTRSPRRNAQGQLSILDYL